MSIPLVVGGTTYQYPTGGESDWAARHILWATAVSSVVAGSVISGSGATNQLTYWSSASALTGNANMLIDGANFRLGIGSAVAPPYTLDLRSATNQTSFHLRTNATTDDGGYLISEGPDDVFLAGGVALIAGNWTAKNNSAGILAHSAASVRFYQDVGLTIGNTYTPTQKLQISNTQIITGTGINNLRPLLGGNTDLGSAAQFWQNFFCFNASATNIQDSVPTTRISMPALGITTITGTQADGGGAVALAPHNAQNHPTDRR